MNAEMLLYRPERFPNRGFFAFASSAPLSAIVQNLAIISKILSSIQPGKADENNVPARAIRSPKEDCALWSQRCLRWTTYSNRRW